MNDPDTLTRREILTKTGRVALGTALGLAASFPGCRGSMDATKPHGVSSTPQASDNETAQVKFTDITREANLDFIQANGTCERRYFVEQVAAGAALFDANGDGFLDIYFPQPKPLGVCKSRYKEPLHHRLYINDGSGRFTLKPDAFGGVETDYGIAAAVGDYNNDGHPDLDRASAPSSVYQRWKRPLYTQAGRFRWRRDGLWHRRCCRRL